MAFNLRVLEIGDCYTDHVVVLHLELRQSRSNSAWEVELVDREQRRSICTPFEDEVQARRAVETAYEYGREFGRWKIQRAGDYMPHGDPVTPLGWEPHPAQVQA